jgi:heat shock protein HspQ
MKEPEPSPAPKFEMGQIIHHRRYDYRGVIVDHDPSCQADEGWYQHNQTQPDRNQSWYHVLVDGATQTTYVAESNLELDATGHRVVHPLLDRFFQTYLDGKYYPTNSN